MPRRRAHGKAVRGSKLPYRISVAGRACLSVYSLSQQDKDISLRSFPHQVPEDETSCRTSRRRWPMRWATSTTGRASRQPATGIELRRICGEHIGESSNPDRVKPFSGRFAVWRLEGVAHTKRRSGRKIPHVSSSQFSYFDRRIRRFHSPHPSLPPLGKGIQDRRPIGSLP